MNGFQSNVLLVSIGRGIGDKWAVTLFRSKIALIMLEYGLYGQTCDF